MDSATTKTSLKPLPKYKAPKPNGPVLAGLAGIPVSRANCSYFQQVHETQNDCCQAGRKGGDGEEEGDGFILRTLQTTSKNSSSKRSAGLRSYLLQPEMSRRKGALEVLHFAKAPPSLFFTFFKIGEADIWEEEGREMAGAAGSALGKKRNIPGKQSRVLSQADETSHQSHLLPAPVCPLPFSTAYAVQCIAEHQKPEKAPGLSALCTRAQLEGDHPALLRASAQGSWGCSPSPQGLCLKETLPAQPALQLVLSGLSQDFHVGMEAATPPSPVSAEVLGRAQRSAQPSLQCLHSSSPTRALLSLVQLGTENAHSQAIQSSVFTCIPAQSRTVEEATEISADKQTPEIWLFQAPPLYISFVC